MKKLLFLLTLIYCRLNLLANAPYVVAIHGLLSDGNTMGSIARSFRCAGMEVYAWHYPSTEGTICSHGQALVKLLEEIAACRPDQPIDFITHSVGALVLRQALNIEGCPIEAKIGRAVLLAPPNQGSRLARNSKGIAPVHWALGSKIGCELMTYDPCTIQAIGPFPSTMEVLVIAGTKGNHLLFKEPNDGFVAVNETALETPFYFESYKVNHSGLLTNPKVLNSAKSFLLSSRPSKEELLEEKTDSK